MVIAINLRVLSGDSSITEMLVACFGIIAANQPEHEFIFIAEKELTKEAGTLKNVKRIVLPQRSNNALLWKLWYNYKLPAVLKKNKAAILISADGISSLRTKLPQCLLVSDLSFLHHQEWFTKKYVHFIEKNTPAFLQKAKHILTLSDVLKNEIHQQYQIDEKRISVLSAGTDAKYLPLNDETREGVKEKYAEGKAYFLFSGTIHSRSSLVNLLKAFSLFKKRQKSNMLLIIASATVAADKAFVESLKLYKYRKEIKLLENCSEDLLQKITASAYAGINTSPLHTDIAHLLNVMQCEIPVITANLFCSKEMLGEAALYVNEAVPEDIAEKLILLYKDEARRNDLIQKGIKQSAKFDLNTTAAQLWEIILTIIQQR